MFAEAPQVKDTGFLETLSLKGELVFVLSHLNFGSPLKLPCCGSSQSCAARVVFWVGHEKLHESETKKKKENVFMMSCSLEMVVRQRMGTATYLMVRGRSLGASLGDRLCTGRFADLPL